MHKFYAIIGVNGKIKAGKDTFAGFLKKALSNKGFQVDTVHFADELKNVVSQVFDIDKEKLLTQEGKNEPYRFNPLIKNRDVLQLFGTNVARLIDDNIWVRKTMDKITKIFHRLPRSKTKRYRGHIVIVPDMRFINEVNAIKNYGGVEARSDAIYKPYIICIKRTDKGYKPANQKHESEWGLDPYPYFSPSPKGVLEWLYNFCIKRHCRRMHAPWTYVLEHKTLDELKNNAIQLAHRISEDAANEYQQQRG